MTQFRSKKDGNHYPINSGKKVYPDDNPIKNKSLHKNKEMWTSDEYPGYAVYRNPLEPDILIHRADVSAHRVNQYDYKYAVYRSGYPSAQFIGGSSTLSGAIEIANKEHRFSPDELHECWAKEKTLTFNSKKYKVGKMSYGDYFLEPADDIRGETEGFSGKTMWLEKQSIVNQYGANQIIYKIER